MKNIVFLLLVFFCLVQPAVAQNAIKPENFSSKATAQDAQTLITNRYRVLLWGIEAAHVKGSPLSLRGRSAMDNLINDQPITCNVVTWRGEQPIAQCFNAKNIDLGAAMLEQGYAVVLRQSVTGTAYEEPYATAEQTAKVQRKGIWSDTIDSNLLVSASLADAHTMLPVILVVVGSSLFTLLLMSLFILRGFKKIEMLLKKSMALTRAQEERMRKREKFVVAAMLEGELLANKGKIEAFLVINRDVLNSLNVAKNNNKQHKYQQSTEILQQKPILSRAVFDGNTDKLELLGTQFAKDIVDLYNDVSSEADFVTFEKHLPLEEAINQTQKIVLNAERLIDPIDHLLNGLQIILNDRKMPQVGRIKDEDTFDID